MDITRKGKCTNFANCTNADSNLVIELPVTADFICPECEKDLEEILVHTRKPIKKGVFAISSIILIGLILLLVIRHKAASETPADSANTSERQNVAKENLPEGNAQPTPPQRPPVDAEESHAEGGNTQTGSNSTATRASIHPVHDEPYKPVVNLSNLEKYLGQLTGKSITLKQKDDLKPEILKLFASDAVVHKMVDVNGHLQALQTAPVPISAFLDAISPTAENFNESIKIVQPIKLSGNKIQDIYVQEIYQ